MATNGPTNHTDQYQPSNPPATTAPAIADQSNANLSKDEVAWFFVEQYYTTLSKNPEKLHLFYGKRSQFVYGQEGQSANVSVGRQSIQDRIKDLDFQNCKVRVSNVDSQASFDNIVIQVIGETSNNAGDPKKFAQTFVLAQQPSGYFVLNDILRFIDDEGEEASEPMEQEALVAEAEAPLPPVEEAKEAEPVEEQSVQDQPASFDPEVVDKKLEEASVEPQTASVGDNAAPEPVADEPATTPEVATEETSEIIPDAETAAQELAEENVEKVEKPHEPTPTPVLTRPPAPAPAPVPAPATATAPAPASAAAAAAPAPALPPKPMTWASRAAAAAGPFKVTPAMPLPKAAPVPVPTRPAAAPTPAAAPQATAPIVQAPQTTAPPKEAGAEWQTAGGDSKRQNRPQSISGPPAEKDGTLGYVKYVTDKVDRDELHAVLAKHGELTYFDINRTKNCAFVEFATAAGCQAAIAANPHVINGESIVVEPRRPKAGAYGGSNYNAGRGNVHNRGGRGGFDGGRSGGHSSRGSFGGQNRGRGGLPRSRGASQAANA